MGTYFCYPCPIFLVFNAVNSTFTEEKLAENYYENFFAACFCTLIFSPLFSSLQRPIPTPIFL